VPEDLVVGLMETAERDFRRGLAQELVAAEKATVLIYVDASKEVGDVDHLKVFANDDAAERWFVENDQGSEQPFSSVALPPCLLYLICA
jgi:hypothetical protein